MGNKIYINGKIITVDKNFTVSEAVVTKKDKIIYVGSTLKAKEFPGKIIDLAGKTMLPGFIDGHSHFFMAALLDSITVTLSAPPMGNVESIDDIINLLKKRIKDENIKPGEMVIGMGYDESLLKDKRRPTRDDLDKVSTVHGVHILHQSLHAGIANSYALNGYEIDETTKDPEGGHIGRYEGTTKPNGLLEEKANMNLMMKLFGKPSIKEVVKLAKKGEYNYLKYGVTTAQDGGLTKESIMAYTLLKFLHVLKIDVHGYYFATSEKEVDEFLELKRKGKFKKGKFKLSGIKVLLDGSPQAKTAWLTEPYYIIPKGLPADYRGYPFVEKDEDLQPIYDKVVKNKLQVLTHNNGDAASDQLLRVYEQAQKNTGVYDFLRPVMIHAQTVREDQLDRMKKLEMMPSFFNLHTYFWGDWHLDSVLGPVRGARISPCQSAVKRELPFTVHCDNPVLPVHTPYMLWSAVNRLTRSNRIIGKDQRITIEEAIKAQTIYAAYQYFEEDIKGSIEVGKQADLVILDQNPLEIEAIKLRDIKILETIKSGKAVYKA